MELTRSSLLWICSLSSFPVPKSSYSSSGRLLCAFSTADFELHKDHIEVPIAFTLIDRWGGACLLEVVRFLMEICLSLSLFLSFPLGICKHQSLPPLYQRLLTKGYKLLILSSSLIGDPKTFSINHLETC